MSSDNNLRQSANLFGQVAYHYESNLIDKSVINDIFLKEYERLKVFNSLEENLKLSLDK